MRDKIYRWITVFILATLLVGSIIYGFSLKRSYVKQSIELERRALEYENLYTQTTELYSENLEIIERTESELENLRTANIQLREIADELDAENRILERTVSEFGDLHGELAVGTSRAEELIRAIEVEARRALDCVGRIQAGIDEPD